MVKVCVLKKAAGYRFLLWFTPATCHQGKQLHLVNAAQWINSYRACTAQLLEAWHNYHPYHGKALYGELLSFIITSSAGLMSANSSTMCCTAELHADLLLTLNTFRGFTGCKHKSFILYGDNLLHILRVFTLKILLIWSISDFPGKRGFWVRSSPNMQPTDHMSTAVEYSCGEKSKHRGSPQKHKADSLPGMPLR